MGDESGKALWARPAFWKSALVIAPLIGTALFFASGTHAQTSVSATPSTPTSANGPVAPLETTDAARRKGPKIKEKEATNDRVANPATTTEPVAPIASPEAARTGRPKERDKEATGRVANPTPAVEPVAQPTERRRKGPKERDDPVLDTSRTETPAPATEPAATSEAARTGRPKIRGKPASNSSRTGGASATTLSRSSNLLLPALGGVAAIAAIVAVSSGNDRPASP